MTKPKPKPKCAVDAVQTALERETARRGNALKPIEIVKIAISAYQSYFDDGDVRTDASLPESSDRAGLRRGTQASIDHLLFNANYWRAAYEDRIVAACSDSHDALACLKAASVWNTHTLKLNTLSASDVQSTFERFCPPFASNNRRGSDVRTGTGKGPVADFRTKALEVAEHESAQRASMLHAIIDDMQAEADAYGKLTASPLDALFDLLPAWCLQERIELVCGNWWDDSDVMSLVSEQLGRQFLDAGYSEVICQYFLDSCREAVDAYQRDICSDPSPFSEKPIPDLLALVRNAREAHPNYEADGYGDELPAWLIDKEQLIWNILVCAIYGPVSARPLLGDSPGQRCELGYEYRSDVITELASTSYARYTADRSSVDVDIEFTSFGDQPLDLKNSSIEHIRSIPGKLEVLGYEIVPLGTTYPDQRIFAFTPSEIECLAILEHRRWLDERTQAGWVFAAVKNVDAKTSPYLVPWEDLPDRAREWNRSAVRNIPKLLASANLAIVRR